MAMLDTGLVFFIGFVVLFIWRNACWWHCCGHFLRRFNYITLGFALMLFILVYDSIFFWATFFDGANASAWNATPPWLRVIVYISAFAIWPILATSAMQVYKHVEHIREEAAVLRHDRAVQVIILPMVYATMCMSCVTKCYAFLVSDTNSAINDLMPVAIAKAETCLWIADLYEAWALYQFGVLTLELLHSQFKKDSFSQDAGKKAAGGALMHAHPAISRLAQLGIVTFVIVSVADCAVALFFIVVGSGSPNFVSAFNNAESAFDVAGFLASCTAIYNVYVVETQFHHELEEFSPFLKFLTVKILVSFAYGQQYFFVGLQAIYSMFPALQSSISRIPVLGSLVKFNNAEFYAFYSALLIIECLFIALLHLWAWGSEEHWYEEELPDSIEDIKGYGATA